MKDFTEFEPSSWLEDGMLVRLKRPTFGAIGKRSVALFAAVAVSLSSIGLAEDLTLRLSAYASADGPPVERQPFSASSARKGDADHVRSGYWSDARALLEALPVAADEDDSPDGEPLI